MSRRLLFLFFLIASSGISHATVTLTVSIASISARPAPSSYIEADLQNCPDPTILNTSQTVRTPQTFPLNTQTPTLTITIPDNITQITCDGNQLSYWSFFYVIPSTSTRDLIKSAELPAGNFQLANLANITAPPWNPGVIQGPPGPPGSVANFGATGPQGLTGLTGATGPAGIQGIPGVTGAQGATGPIGPTGPGGATVSGTPNAIALYSPSGNALAAGPFTVTSPSSGVNVFAMPGANGTDTVFTQYYHTLYGGPISEFPGTLKADTGLFTPYSNINANNLGSGSNSYVSIFSNNQTTTPGYNHGTAAAETHNPFYWTYANAYASGFRSPFGFQVTDFAPDGDEQVFDFSYLDRPGTIAPSDEGHHRWRTEHQSVLPYYGNVASSGTDSNGHPYLNLTPQYNPQTLAASLPLLDVTTLRSDTVTAPVVPSGGGNLSTSILTVGGTYGVSTTGTLAASISAGATPVNTPVTVTALVNWTGPALTTSSRIVMSPTSPPNNGDSHQPEVVWPSATPVNNGNGTWSVPMEILQGHDAGDNFTVGGEAGNYVEYTDKTFGYGVGGYLLNPYVEIILASTAHTLQTAYPLTGAMGTIGHVSPIHIYYGAMVLDGHPQAGTLATLQHTTFAPATGDSLVQPNNTAGAYFDELDNEEVVNPYGSWVWKQLNMQTSVINPTYSAIFPMTTPPNLSAFVLNSQMGPLFSSPAEPSAQLNVNGSNFGDRYVLGFQLVSNPFKLIEGAYSTGGRIDIGFNPFTQRMSQPPPDFTVGGISTIETGQAGGITQGTFTGSGSGTTLTVSGLTGYVFPGSVLAGTGVPANTTVVVQLTGTTNGAGTYQTSVATTASGSVTASNQRFNEYAHLMNGTGANPMFEGDAYSFGGTAVTANPIFGRFGYCYGPCIASGNTIYPLANAALAASLHDQYVLQARGHPVSIVANDSDTAAALTIETTAGVLQSALFTPASSTASCNTGDIAHDATYMYWCTSTNHWLRVAGASF